MTKKKSRGFDPSRFKTHDGPLGSAAAWSQKAAALLKKTGSATQDERLELLGLTKLPTDQRSLRKAYLAAMRKAHPDAGGSDELAAEVTAAYEALKEML